MALQINVGFYGDKYMFWGVVYPLKWNQDSPYWTEWVWGWFLQLAPMKVTVLHHTVCFSVYEPLLSHIYVNAAFPFHFVVVFGMPIIA